MELWRVYGSKSEYRKAPRLEALKVRLILQKKQQLDNAELAAQQKHQADLDARWQALMGNH